MSCGTSCRFTNPAIRSFCSALRYMRLPFNVFHCDGLIARTGHFLAPPARHRSLLHLFGKAKVEGSSRKYLALQTCGFSFGVVNASSFCLNWLGSIRPCAFGKGRTSLGVSFG